MKYKGNNPKRRIAKPGFFEKRELAALATAARYQGSPHHKTKPADYCFTPPTAPRPTKSICDGQRIVLKGEAQDPLRQGIRRGLVSTHLEGDHLEGAWPKYVWAVDASGEVYEAKLGHDQRRYHGYRLEEDDAAMRKWVTVEWQKRQAG